jgi:hypothetical protein
MLADMVVILVMEEDLFPLGVVLVVLVSVTESVSVPGGFNGQRVDVVSPTSPGPLAAEVVKVMTALEVEIVRVSIDSSTEDGPELDAEATVFIWEGHVDNDKGNVVPVKVFDMSPRANEEFGD